MKKSSFLILLLSVMLVLPAVTQAQKSSKKKKKNAKVETVVLTSNLDTISYIIGADIARSFKTNDVEVNYDMMNVGIQAGLKGADTLFTPEQIQQIMTAWNQDLMKKRQDKAALEYTANLQKGAAFLAENKTKPGVVELPSGLQYKIIKDGVGTSPVDTSFVTVDYVGTLIDGTVFDSSRERGEPIEFALNGVIAGWTEGLKLMKPGAVYMLYIPAELAYGERKMGSIPAGSTLIFEVELHSIKQ